MIPKWLFFLTWRRPRGFVEEDFVRVAEFIDRGIKITKRLKDEKKQKVNDFRANVDPKDPEIVALRADVEAFAGEFPPIGFSVEDMRYP